MKPPDPIHNPGPYWEALLKPIMKEADYRKKGRSWYYHTPETIGVLNLQLSNWGGGDFYINLGVLLRAINPELWPKEYRCHLRVRLSELMPDLERSSALFHVNPRYSFDGETRRREVLNAVRSIALPFLEKLRTSRDLQDLLTTQPHFRPSSTKKLLDHFGLSWTSTSAER